MAGKFTRAAHLWRQIIQIEFRVKRWHEKYEILNQIGSHNFAFNYVLIKSNCTALQTYKVEERILGTPCIYLTDFLKTSPADEICSHLSEKASKGRFLKPENLQYHSNEGR